MFRRLPGIVHYSAAFFRQIPIRHASFDKNNAAALFSKLYKIPIDLKRNDDHPCRFYYFEHDGNKFEVQVNNFPEEAETVYTLVRDGEEIFDFDPLPSNWKLPTRRPR